MKTLLNICIVVEFTNHHLYNELNSELQFVIDKFIGHSMNDYCNNKRLTQPHNATYEQLRDLRSPNLKFRIFFNAFMTISPNFDEIVEYIEFEEIPADGDNNKKPIKKKRNER